MERSLKASWNAIETLLDQGISVIPAREKPEIYNGKEYAAKTPAISSWKQYTKEIIDRAVLWHKMESANTTAIAMICGEVSGNLEVIDVDVKHWPEIPEILFEAIRDNMPGMREHLRYHQSPSGGYHIMYRISDGKAEGSQKLAWKEGQKESGIETRGEGGYVIAPPSFGYTAVKNGDHFPVITMAERNQLISVCKMLNQKVKAEKPVHTRYENDYYDENPFDHFNGSPAAETVLADHGWTFESKQGNYTRYTRPGKDSGISASWMSHKRLFWMFTSSTDFEGSRGYQPATALGILRFGGDMKKTRQYLVEQGYGRIKKHIEQKIVRDKALSGKPLPTNISKEAATEYVLIKSTIDQTYPHGVYWFLDDDVYKINREKLYQVTCGLGFRLDEKTGDVVRIVGHTIQKVNERTIIDTIKDYIKEEDHDTAETIKNAYEAFVQRNVKFTLTRIELLDQSQVAKDTRDTCMKFYQNGFLVITADSIDFQSYEVFDKLVHADRIQPRDYIPPVAGYEGMYLNFLRLAVEYDQRPEYIQSIVGFLTHEYKDETTGYIIVLTEMCEDPRDGGGSGKNIFSGLLKYQTSYMNTPGAQKKFDEKFLQAWNGQRIMSISDVPKNFDYSFLKELATGSGLIKKLFQNEREVGVEDMPKFIIQTNYSYDVSDGGVRRRVIPVEFTNFFTQCGGVDVHFKARFPNDWTTEDWSEYDHIIHSGIQQWIAGGLKLQSAPLTHGGWIKQFEQQYGQHTHQFIEEYFEKWCNEQYVKTDEFNRDYDRFCNENNINIKWRASGILMNRALDAWSKKHQVKYDPNARLYQNGIDVRSKMFLRNGDVPF